jgi:glycosyltransferase involved in cell wall biosynthesis
MLREHGDIHFLLIGSGAKASWLKDTANERGLGNVTILPHRRRDELADSLNACDVAVISFVRGMAGVSVPSRMYNVLAAGKPIVAAADADSELAQVVLEERVGWVVEPGRPERMAQAILAAREATEERTAMGTRARAVAEQKYTLDNVIAAYRALVTGLDS